MSADSANYSADGFAATMRAADICAELNLVENEDGLWVNDTQTLILLPVGGYMPWQKADCALDFIWRGGAPMAFSFSADGHDAAAVHLGPQEALHQKLQHRLAAEIWHTGESLGNWTLLERRGGFERIEKAAPDWFPTPRPGADGRV